jgi:hypothetical protein
MREGIAMHYGKDLGHTARVDNCRLVVPMSVIDAYITDDCR